MCRCIGFVCGCGCVWGVCVCDGVCVMVCVCMGCVCDGVCDGVCVHGEWVESEALIGSECQC